MKIRDFTYTKDNGDTSYRKAIVVSEPRSNYLMYDITEFSDKELETLVDALEKAEEYRDNCMADFELLAGIKLNTLWRSFKPDGIVWDKDIEY